MKHTIITYTVDIATNTDFDETDLLMEFDAVLEAHPREFEDWKTKIKKEERDI